jgi:hypothetical protein
MAWLGENDIEFVTDAEEKLGWPVQLLGLEECERVSVGVLEPG